ncbi:hypothetical protein [Psychroflexus montanilacus]|uniref:hypothetical protein n=1 Tax=Psychroflexus montanilacus TaxID=2873598 RepID=UPI001CC9AC05|nr:hypothetical protein [Psychroflexus montanilacus]MBZ9650627.1 hypothetical protein [Psychroflexus montanilacus]
MKTIPVFHKMNLILFLVILFNSFNFNAQSFEGSWQLVELNDEKITDREVIKIVTDGYFALGSKSVEDNSFLGAAGGEFKIKGESLIEKRDFDTYDDGKIGKAIEYQLNWIDNQTLEIANEHHRKVWKKLNTNKDDLKGNWVITGRQRDGNLNTMKPGDRRTIKILAGGRFQWVAFNSAEKTFNGTGAGTYSAKNGKYQENILLFSRDKDRVGDALSFEYEVIKGEWHHKGNSSKGQPIYEIWSPYSKAYPTDF